MPQQQVRLVTTRKRRRRNNRRANKSRVTTTTTVNRNLSPNGPASQSTFRIPRVNRVVKRAAYANKLSDSGLAFLKCAFASPDFGVDPGKGIPDKFEGRTLSIKDCATTAITFAPGKDTYIVVAPVPGYAYFKCEVGIGEEPIEFYGTPYTTFETNFGRGHARDNNYSRFRYASLAAGIYPTSNYMNFGGSISTWRVDLALSTTSIFKAVTQMAPEVNAQFMQRKIAGLESLQALVPRDNVTQSFIRGAFAYAYDRSGEFEWSEFEYGTHYNQGTADSGKGLYRGPVPGDGPNLPGLGNTNTLVYKVTTPVGAVNTCVFKTWNCVELQPNTNSALYQFSGASPSYDPLAIEAYNKVKMELPVAVAASENAGMWAKVVGTLRNVFRIGSFLPGTYGDLSRGLETVTTGLQNLFF